MARLPIVAANWKMHTNLQECQALLRALRAGLKPTEAVEVVVCPPFPFLAVAAQELEGSALALGAQNAHWEQEGAYTGEVSPRMLAGLCRYVILGHSERRAYFAETNAIVNRKLHAALQAGLRPILCIGETLPQREDDRTEEILVRQLWEGLAGIAIAPELVVAYEPVWAIGTGRAATGSMANEACALIRRELAALATPEIAQAIRIQYGGSVSPQNIAEFVGQPEIDGALVGGASLKAESFIAIAQVAAQAKALLA